MNMPYFDFRWSAIFFYFLFPVLLCSQSSSAKIAFRTLEKDLIAEGISWDKKSGNFYIGSIHKNKIVQISPSGKNSDFVKSKQDGLGQVLGLHIDSKRRHLWACSNEAEFLKGGKSSVHQYDLHSGNLIQKYEYREKDEIHLFNDIIVLESGEVYLTDSDSGAIFKIDPSKNSIEPFLKSDLLIYCNGITSSLNEQNLIVSTARGIVSVNLHSKEIKRMNLNYLSVADGLYKYKQSLIAIQNVFFPVSIVQFQMDNDFHTLEKAHSLLVDHPLFDIPTTGVIADDWFYFIANSQLGNRRENKIIDPSALKETLIMKIKLN